MRSPKLASTFIVLSLAAAPSGAALAHGPGDGYVAGGGNMMPLMMQPYVVGQAGGQMPMGQQMGPRGAMPGGTQRGPMGPSGGAGRMGPGMGYGQMGYGQMGPGRGYGQMMGSRMGYGQMGPGGQMMMYGSRGGAYPWLGWRVLPPLNLTVDDVREVLKARIADLGNDRLKVGEVKAGDDDQIVADIVTVDNSLVERLSVDKHTGVIEYTQ